MRVVQELTLLPLLAKTQAHYFVGFLKNRPENLIIVFSLQGPDAHFFGKDLQLKMSSWQFNNPEKLHLALLDLNKECRLQKLQFNFALSSKNKHKLIIACQGGSILLKRKQQIKQLLISQNDIQMLVGQYNEGDQLVLIAGNPQLGEYILEKHHQHSLEVILQEKLQNYLKDDFKTALLLWHYQVKEELPWTNKVEKLKNYVKKIKKIPQKINGFWKRIKNLRFEQKKRYQKIFLIFAGLTLIGSAAFSFWHYQEQQVLLQVNQEIQALSISDEELVSLSTSQPVLAREKIQNSQNKLSQLLNDSKSLLAKRKIEEEIEQLEFQATQLASENNLDRLIILSDWYDDFPDFLGNKILASPQGILLANDQRNQLLLIQEGNQFELRDINFSDFTIDRNNSEELNIFIKDQGIKYLNWSNNNIMELKSEGDVDRDGSLLESYQNYIYLLNTEKRNIYRYTLRNSELSEAIAWLVDKQGVSFNNISDMSVDGNLWLSFKDGQIIKFSRGFQQEFTLTGLEQMPSSALLIASQENSEKIAFLDKAHNRLIVTTKEGQLISEIKSNELAGISDIVLANDGQSCLALSGSVIYQIQL